MSLGTRACRPSSSDVKTQTEAASMAIVMGSPRIQFSAKNAYISQVAVMPFRQIIAAIPRHAGGRDIAVVGGCEKIAHT